MTLTLEDCRKIIHHYAKDESTAESFKIKPLSDSPMGYLGDHYKLYITFKNLEGLQICKKFFLKTLPHGNPEHTQYVIDLGIFNKEALLYSKLLTEFQSYHELPIAPASYLVDPEKYIVLEDLTAKGFETNDHLKPRHIVELVKTLARFHSSSVIYEEQRSVVNNNPYKLIHEYKEVLIETTFNRNEGHPRFKWARNTAQAVVDTMINRNKEFQSMGQQFYEFVTNEIFEYVLPSAKYRNVINHADLWKNNAMFQRNEKHCVIIDFQLVRYSPPALDLMTTLHLNCSSGYLQDNMQALLSIYYQTFEESLKHNGVDLSVIFQNEAEFRETVKHYNFAALTVAAMFATIIFIGPELGDEIANNKFVFNEFTYTNRSKHILRELKRNKEFAHKYSDILDRLIECMLRNK